MDFISDSKAINVVSSKEIPDREYKGLTELKEKKKHINTGKIKMTKIIQEKYRKVIVKDIDRTRATRENMK